MISDCKNEGVGIYDGDSQGIIAHIPEASKRGITLRGLRKLQSLLEKITAEGLYFEESDFNAISTHDIVNKFIIHHVHSTYDYFTDQICVNVRWIKHKDVTGISRLADCPNLIDSNEVMMPSYFISHAW